MHSALSSGAAELIAADHYAKREIMKLEEELPKWRTIIDTGAPPGRPSYMYMYMYMIVYIQYLHLIISGVEGWNFQVSTCTCTIRACTHMHVHVHVCWRVFK